MISIRKEVKSSSNTAFKAPVHSVYTCDFGRGSLLRHQTFEAQHNTEKNYKKYILNWRTFFQNKLNNISLRKSFSLSKPSLLNKYII